MAEKEGTQEPIRFNENEVTTMVKSAIEATLAGKKYNYEQAKAWTTQIWEGTLEMLKEYKKPFKYVVTVVINEKKGVGLHEASECFWNEETDGSVRIRWENDTMLCLVLVFGLAIA